MPHPAPPTLYPSHRYVLDVERESHDDSTVLAYAARFSDVDDDRWPCVVPRCGVRSRKLDAHGMCPSVLWSEDHFEYARGAAMNFVEERSRRLWAACNRDDVAAPPLPETTHADAELAGALMATHVRCRRLLERPDVIHERKVVRR